MQKEEAREHASKAGAWPNVDTPARAKRFALRVIRLCRFLDARPGVGRTLSRQVLRSGTSIGANLWEAQPAQTRPGFVAKLSIALKEARETAYWFELLIESGLVAEPKMYTLRDGLDRLTRVLVTSVVTAKKPAH